MQHEDVMPNLFAYLMLALWPVVTVVFFRRLSPSLAFIWSLLLGYLFLPPPPAAFDFPLMPPLHKEIIPALAALLSVVMIRDVPVQLIPRSRAARLLMLIFILSPVATVLNNTEPVYWGELTLPGLGVTDAMALAISQFLLLVPFLLARHLLASDEAHRQVVLAFAIAGLIYSLPVLAEVRLAPQINAWTYGYFQEFFHQTIRFGGWRPTVFLQHGLWLAFFMMMALVAAAALLRYNTGYRLKWALAVTYFGVVLVLCKSLGALLFAVFLVPLLLFVRRKAQLRIAALIAIAALAYPAMKGTDTLPSQTLLTLAEQIDDERAGSLRFRFYNEDLLRERAEEKPLFGWGSWGRNHIHNPYSGSLETVSDGRWVITLGVYGWVGFLAEFGLLTLPIFLLWKQAMGTGRRDLSDFAGPLSLLLAINVLDLLPNATLTPLTWILSGALLGYAERVRPVQKDSDNIRLPSWRPAI